MSVLSPDNPRARRPTMNVTAWIEILILIVRVLAAGQML